MKTKRFEKKLSLNKETVMDLNQMVIVKGGDIDKTFTKYTCLAITCNTDCYCSDYLTVCGSDPCC